MKVIDLVKSIIAEPRFDDFDRWSLYRPVHFVLLHICEGLNLQKEDFSVVSISKKGEPLQLTVGMDSESKVLDKTAVLDPSPLVTGQTRSQDFQSYYRVNGGFYILVPA